MKTTLLSILFLITLVQFANSQSCSPQGNQTTYGSNNVWIGYVYNSLNMTSYKGYVNEGTSSSPNFDESFGGSNTFYSTHGCDVKTETFSVRFKLAKTFTGGVYTITVGGDDGYRLSIDGGNTWIIDQWTDHPYQTTAYSTYLNGTYNLVLEYYENGGDNRVTFNVSAPSCGTENTTVYGTGNSWNAYIYDGTNFNTYVGMVHVGNSSDASFNENFGGSNHQFGTSGCSLQTETFSVRYRLTKTFASGTYTFVVGADDGYRLSIDGGNTWIINNWNDHSYTSSSYTVQLNGTYNVVLEYYENSGDNNVTFFYQVGSALAVKLVSFTGQEKNGKAELAWEVTADSDPAYFEVEKSLDGTTYSKLSRIEASAASNSGIVSFQYTDATLGSAVTYYRLKSVDQSGVITYSGIISLKASGSDNNTRIYPTVVSNNNVTLKAGKDIRNATMIVTDAAGRRINQQPLGSISAGQQINLPVFRSTSSKGIYLVTVIENNNPVITERIVVQ